MTNPSWIPACYRGFFPDRFSELERQFGPPVYEEGADSGANVKTRPSPRPRTRSRTGPLPEQDPLTTSEMGHAG